VVDCSRQGFLLAMDVSCHSFIRMARLAEPLMTDGGSLFTMSHYGAEKVVENYDLGRARPRVSPRSTTSSTKPRRARQPAVS
jgi:enoyl-[acyl-carrier protein] reductase I